MKRKKIRRKLKKEKKMRMKAGENLTKGKERRRNERIKKRSG